MNSLSDSRSRASRWSLQHLGHVLAVRISRRRNALELARAHSMRGRLVALRREHLLGLRDARAGTARSRPARRAERTAGTRGIVRREDQRVEAALAEVGVADAEPALPAGTDSAGNLSTRRWKYSRASSQCLLLERLCAALEQEPVGFPLARRPACASAGRMPSTSTAAAETATARRAIEATGDGHRDRVIIIPVSDTALEQSRQPLALGRPGPLRASRRAESEVLAGARRVGKRVAHVALFRRFSPDVERPAGDAANQSSTWLIETRLPPPML